MLRMKRLLCLFLICVSFAGIAQDIPQVPSKIQIADMKLTITEGARKDIQKDVDMLRSSDKFFRLKLDRVVLYMPLVERLLKEENIPDDIKYLAIQESSFIPDAVSTSKAVGFWQFKDFTAKEVGMRVDNKIDERKNIHASTIGAAKYFKSHQKQLDNWANSINSHMTGLAGIKKYISPKDKGSKKMTITKKTHWYLKRFIAHKIAFQNELNHKNSKGLELLEYKKGAGKDLAKIAKEFKVDVEKLKSYNKWLIHGRIPGDKRYVVMVPAQRGNRKARQLAENSNDIERKKAKIETRHTSRPTAEVVYPKGKVESFAGDQSGAIRINGVKAILAGSGDDFNSVLERSGLKEKKFLKFNDLGSRSKVKPGDIYFIKSKKSKSAMGFYTVNRGESLWDISQKLGIKLSALLKKNRMSIRDIPKPGRVLWLSAKRPARIEVEYQDLPPVVEKPEEFYPTKLKQEESAVVEETPQPEEKVVTPGPKPEKTKPEVKAERDRKSFKTHIVMYGETFWSIARTYGITVPAILEWNELKEGTPLSVGQELLIDGNKVATSKPKEVPEKKAKPSKIHIVRGGETFYAIARKYGMNVNELLKLNKMDDTALLSVGRELKVVASSSAKEEKPQSKPNLAKKKAKTHKVEAGESFYAIARKNQMSVDDLLELNGLSDSDVLSIGQELKVFGSPSKKEEKEDSILSKEEKTNFHEVKPGETLYSIARQYNMSVDELKQLNNKTDNSLSLGEKLKVNK